MGRYQSEVLALAAAMGLLVGGAARAELPRVDLGVGIWDHDVSGTLTSDDPLLQVPAGFPLETEKDLYGRFSVRLGNRWWAPTVRARYTDLGAGGHTFVDNSTFLGNILLNLNTVDTTTTVEVPDLEGLVYFTLGSDIRAELGGGIKKIDGSIETVRVNRTSGGTTTTTSRRGFPIQEPVFYGGVFAEPASWLSFGAEIVGGAESVTELMDLTFRFMVRPWDWLGVEGGYRRLTMKADNENGVNFDFEFGGPYAGLSFFYATPEPVAEPEELAAETPAEDNDGDGVPDGADECPGSSGGIVVDERGCPQGEAAAADAAAPAAVDADSDGVADEQDTCPETPGGAPVDGSGCLQGDRDQDGVADDKDFCPGGASGAVDSTGCPTDATPPAAAAPAPAARATGPDEDDDGVPDAADRCRRTVRGLKVDGSGCAMAGESSVLQGITFQKNSSYLMRDSQVLLMEVVEGLKAQRTMKVEIQGHTCDLGDAKYNQWLSQRRANRVLEFFVRHGIDARRLTAIGYGESQPMIPNDDESMRELNRRTVFKVISQ
jgi:outer membrane protein OmpA-like peptidoglycan-associated protein